MPSKANSNANNSNGGTGSTYHTQRYGGGRRSSARRGEAARSRPAEEPAAAANERKTTAVSNSTNENSNAVDTTRAEQRPRNTRAASRPQHLDKEMLHGQDAAASTTSSHMLNAFSPAFIPKQYQSSQQQQQDTEVKNALSFSAAISPLAYVGSMGAASTTSSPLVFAASVANAQPSLTSSSTPSLCEVPSGTLQQPPHTSNDRNTTVVGSNSAMQLRDAYARAAAAKAAASANCDTRSTSLTSQLLQPQSQPQPSTAPQLTAAGMYTFSVTEGGAASSVTTPQFQVPAQRHQQQHQPQQQQPPSTLPQQRSSPCPTASSTPAVAAVPNAVYGPSVSVFHPQFIDVATGTTSMTPFALHDDYVDEFTHAKEEDEAEGDAAGAAGAAVAAMAQEIIDAVPLPSQQQQQRLFQQQVPLQQQRQYEVDLEQRQQQLYLQRQLAAQQQQHQLQQQQPVLQTALSHRVCATTVAILASHDAPTAQLSSLSSTRRGDRAPPIHQQQRQQATVNPAVSLQATENVRVQGNEEVEKEELVVVAATARPTPSSQRRTTTTTTVITGSVASATQQQHLVEEVSSQETPQRRPRQSAAAAAANNDTNNINVGVVADIKSSSDAAHTYAVTASTESDANTVERLYACMANTDERTEDGHSVTSKMGLTGSVRRGVPPRYDEEDDDDINDRCDYVGVNGEGHGAVTPTATPTKVLAVEGSPFVAAAAAEGATATARPPRPNRRLLTEEDSAIILSESSLCDSTGSNRAHQQLHQNAASPNNSGTNLLNAHLQRAMMHLMAQIQTNNSKGAATAATTATSAGSPKPKTTTMTTIAITATPQKVSANTTAHTQSGLTPVSFKTPEIEREPSARPSASKNSTCRTITTIIHTPNTTATTTASGHRNSNNKAGAQEASAFTAESTRHNNGEVFSPLKSAQRSLASCLEAIASAKPTTMTTTRHTGHDVTATENTQQQQQSSSSRANPSAMPVPRSQRRGASRQGNNGYNGTATASTSANNNGMMSNATMTTTNATSPLLLSLSAAAPSTQYAVVIDGHMGRRVTAVSSTPLKAGICVLFEEDRGIDMGRVVQCDKLENGEAIGALPTLASATSPLSRKDRPAPVLRPATAEEEYRWLYADVKEAETTLEPCREAAARLGLPVKVVGAVYQFNKAKLTFYYESNTRVDFRPLLPSLFSRFHCRIWMARVETPALGEAKKEVTAFATDAAA